MINKPIARHFALAVAAAIMYLAFMQSRMEWVEDMRQWRAVGDTAFVLLWSALAIGPLAHIYPKIRAIIPWRRPIAIWSGLLALLHAWFILDGWTEWSRRRFFGFEVLPGVPGAYATDPGFGLANLVGLAALLWMILLLAISSDVALRKIGPGAWKHLQQGSRIAFTLVNLHVAYFLFIHYEPSLKALVFGKTIPDANWAQFPFLLLAIGMMVLQSASFLKTVRRKQKKAEA